MNGVVIKTLSKEFMRSNLSQILALEMALIKEVGSIYARVPWNKTNFMIDLNGKWDYSKVTLIEEKIVGFWVVSITVPQNAHTHRVAVSSECQRQKIGESMFLSVIRDLKNTDILNMTLEVNIKNLNAIKFYEELGFKKLKAHEIQDYLMNKGQKTKILMDFVKKNDGSYSYIFAIDLCNIEERNKG